MITLPHRRKAFRTESGSSGDPYFANVSLLLNMNGVNNGTTFTDSSLNAFTVTRGGSTVTSTAQSKFGGSSALFNSATSDRLVISSATALSLGTQGTVECWVRFSSVSGTMTIFSNYQDVPSNSTMGYVIVLEGGVIKANLSGDGRDIVGTTIISINTWYHLAISGSSGSWKLFVNGIQEGSTFTGTVNLNSNKSTTIGALLFLGSFYDYLSGYVDDLRITKDVTRYTANFTPPTAAFPNS